MKRRSKNPKREAKPLTVRLDLKVVVDDAAAAALFRRLRRASAMQEAHDERERKEHDNGKP